jgi:D-arabinonate dehydratase
MPHRITEVEAIAISIPLQEAVSDAVRKITRRDNLIVHIRTDTGLEGVGFSLAYDASLAMVSMVDTIFRELLIGANPFDTEYLWSEMYRQSIQAGRRGAALRTISAIDIALWDLKGKATGLPICELLGGYKRKMRCYATGGYYRDGQTIDELTREMHGYTDRGFTAIKLKVGRLGARQDAIRMAAVRQAVGEDVDLLLDANGGWPDSSTAITAMRRLEEFHPYWIEEPVRADNVAAMARIAAALDTPVATGELEATRWAFADLLTRQAADILQPDATVCGGVTEWLKIAHMAAAYDIPIAPHYHWDVHTQLLAAVPNGLFIEYFVRDSGVKVFDAVLKEPLEAHDGWIEARDQPGFGYALDPEALRRYQISK